MTLIFDTPLKNSLQKMSIIKSLLNHINEDIDNFICFVDSESINQKITYV